jgi:hypothetical protein
MLPFMQGFSGYRPPVSAAEVVATNNQGFQIYFDTPTFTVTLPSEVLVGDTILLVGTMRGSNTSGWAPTVPSGYTSLYNGSFTQGYRRAFAFYKTSSTNGAHTVDLTVTGAPGSNGASASCCAIIIRGNLTAPECGTLTASSGTTPNPPSNTPSGGDAEYLVIPTVHIDWLASTPVDITAPSGYSMLEEASYIYGPSSQYTAAGSGCAILQATGTSFDPGTFTLNMSKAYGTNTITVR